MTTQAPSRSTLADVLAAVLAADLPPRRKQDVASAIRAVAKVIGRAPGDIDADRRTLSVKLRQTSPIAIGIGRARWNNIRSGFNFGFRLVQPTLPGRSKEPIAEAWGVLYALIETRSDRIRMSRPVRWFSAEGISPDTLRLEDLEGYRDMLAERTLLKNPESDWVYMSRAWNRCVSNVSGWPRIRIHRESKTKVYSLPLSAFPQSLLEDIERWCRHVSGADLGDDSPRPFAPVTIRNSRHLFQSFASALVLSGGDPQTLTSIASLVTIENYKKGLQFFVDRLGQTSTVHQKAFKLKSIARHWAKADATTLQAMGRIVKKLDVTEPGLTTKNAARLALLRNEDNQLRLLRLPLTLRRDIEKRRMGSYPARVTAQMAAAIEILIMGPMRLKNVAALEIDRHVHIRTDAVLIIIPAAEIKNDVDLTYELNDESAELIRWYVETQRKAAPDCRFLFPGDNGQHKSESALRQQIMGTIHKYVGVTVNPHLFRHFLAYMHLKQCPGEYEIVRLCLGHKSMETTLRFYAGFEREAALQHYDNHIVNLRRAAGVKP